VKQVADHSPRKGEPLPLSRLIRILSATKGLKLVGSDPLNPLRINGIGAGARHLVIGHGVPLTGGEEARELSNPAGQFGLT
jgi:hypothetical protein